MSSRVTRSQSTDPQVKQGNGPESFPTVTPKATPPVALPTINIRPNRTAPSTRFVNETRLNTALKSLPSESLILLRQKQLKLRKENVQVSTFIYDGLTAPNASTQLLSQGTAATLIFAWEAAGTAICISPEGLLLTCSHCVAESEQDYNPNREQWLLFASGIAVKTQCIAWDPQRDLALLQITVAEGPSYAFPYIRISDSPPRAKARLLCIGHPGSEDFEAETPGQATNYDVLHISEGRFRGLAKGQDPQDNSEIGALMHDCWTYWGHSGAPLVDATSGKLIGLHSSWDDETGMRRGVSWEALRAFLDKQTTSQ